MNNNFFYIQTNIPRKHLNKGLTERTFSSYQVDQDETFLVNLELFATGNLGNKIDIYFFKPWIIDEGQAIDRLMENVLIIIPDYIMFILLESEIFKERYYERL